MNSEISDLNRLMVEHSDKTWVLADLSKSGAQRPYHAVDLEEVNTIVTTHDGVDLFEFEVEGACEILSAPLSSFTFPQSA